MLTKAIRGEMCPRCGSGLEIGLKEEPMGWKVYAICSSEVTTNCSARRIGLISRTEIGHTDDVIDKAERLLKSR